MAKTTWTGTDGKVYEYNTFPRPNAGDDADEWEYRPEGLTLGELQVLEVAVDDWRQEEELKRIAAQLAAVEDGNANTIGASQPEDDLVTPEYEGDGEEGE